MPQHSKTPVLRVLKNTSKLVTSFALKNTCKQVMSFAQRPKSITGYLAIQEKDISTTKWFQSRKAGRLQTLVMFSPAARQPSHGHIESSNDELMLFGDKIGRSDNIKNLAEAWRFHIFFDNR